MEIKDRQGNEVKIVQSFKSLPIGGKMMVPASFMSPSQPDDGFRRELDGAVEACYNEGKILVIHGNHRLYTAKENEKKNEEPLSIPVVKIVNPYFDF